MEAFDLQTVWFDLIIFFGVPETRLERFVLNIHGYSVKEQVGPTNKTVASLCPLADRTKEGSSANTTAAVFSFHSFAETCWPS